MEVEMEHIEEIKRLRGCINNLISVLTLPAIWNNYESSQIVSTLLDVLLGMLRLDFVYARLSDAMDGSPIEFVRVAQPRNLSAQPQEVGRVLDRWLTVSPPTSPTSPLVVPNPVGEGKVSIGSFPLGLQDKIGVLVAGSQRADFPTEIEMLLLRVAANQAAIGLQEARLLSEQRQVAEELERCVVERTRQLTVVNEELRKEISGRKRAEVELLALKDEQTTELTAMTHLHEFSTRLLASTELQPLLEEILTATIALQNADFGNVQLYNPDTQALEIVAYHGFQADFLDYFNPVHEGNAACGQALQRRERIIIEDVQTDPGFAPHREIATSAGFRAAQSTPLFSRSGDPLGMISTHFRHPHCPSEHELRFTDLYARQAAEMIERRRTEQALRESEDYFRSLVDGVKDYAIFMLDPGGRAMTWNNGAERIKGYCSQEILGQHFSRFYEQGDIQVGKPEQALKVATAAGQFEDEGWRVRKDGSRFWAHMVITALKDETGKLKGFAKLTRDMTERKQAEEALDKVQADLAHVTRVTTLGELAASIAHEINQPLTAVVTNANACSHLLAGESPDLAEVREAMVDIAAAGTRASEVIAGIRALLQKAATEKTRLDLNKVIQEVLDLTRSELCTSQISVQTDLPAGHPPVLGDRVQLQQVLLNLIMNGIEAMAASTTWPRRLLIRSQVHDSHNVLVAVRDSGLGLNPQHMDHIFKTFFTTKSGGMGMGLAISRSIIEAHGGQLWAATNPGPGATFHFTLPTSHEAMP
jgi:PAS domain S-box-containing protein